MAADAPSFTSLAGQLLIAMPSLPDPNFAQTVSLVCEHNEFGALGIVINRPLGMTLDEVLDQFELDTDDALVGGAPVYAGGPVQQERGFVVHDGERDFEATLRISSTLAVTTSRDVLEHMASGDGPSRTLVALGFAGWGAGQIEQEMLENSWISAPADVDVIFGLAAERRWEAAARLLGVDVRLIPGEAGHA